MLNLPKEGGWGALIVKYFKKLPFVKLPLDLPYLWDSPQSPNIANLSDEALIF